MGALPESVLDKQLEARIHEGITVHHQPIACRGDRRLQKWTFVKNFGRGGDGTVFLQRKVEGPGSITCLAVKQMHLDAPLASENHNCRRYVRELEALAKFSQEKYATYFVMFYGWYQYENELYLAMEYCEHGDLGSYLKKLPGSTMPEIDAQEIASQLTQGLLHMHHNKYAHRDLKPANVLIKSRPPDRWWVVLADLGLSRRDKYASGSTTVRGSPGFMAPETLLPFGHESIETVDSLCMDMWCLGETISYALTGQPTFPSDHHLRGYGKGRAEFPLDGLRNVKASEQARGFIMSLMRSRPSDRMTAQEAAAHPWLHPRDIKDTEVNIGSEEVLGGYLESIGSSSQSVTEASAKWTETGEVSPRDTTASAEWIESTDFFKDTARDEALSNQQQILGTNLEHHKSLRPRRLHSPTYPTITSEPKDIAFEMEATNSTREQYWGQYVPSSEAPPAKRRSNTVQVDSPTRKQPIRASSRSTEILVVNSAKKPLLRIVSTKAKTPS